LYSVSFSNVFFSSPALAGNPQVIIDLISCDIEQSTDAKAKSTLYIFRARQYSKIEKFEKALADYNNALELDHKGWIHLERSQLLLAVGKYELAYEDANAAKEEVPTLTKEADKVIDKAVAEERKKFETDNPVTIVMNTRVNPYRKTRFDLMRKLGNGSSAPKTQGLVTGATLASSKTTSKASCAPKAKS